MSKYLIAGNWKMNMDIDESISLVNSIISNDKVEVLICPPSTNIYSVKNAINNSIKVGAQNSYYQENGAFTGEVSNQMIRSAGAEYVIIGHSERREIFNESNDLINKKVKSALANQLIPILCIGESLDERKSDQTNDVLSKQITECLDGINNEVIIAYEPIWAIGTGLTPTSEQIEETHKFIKNYVNDNFSYQPKVLYGGSLKDTNAQEILSINPVDGGLIGGASLVSDKFNKIIQIASELS